MTDHASAYDTAAIRDLLAAALGDGELTTLCFDYFRPVYEDLGSGTSKSQKIQRLLEYCDRHEQMERLLRLVEERNPAQYARFAPRLRATSSASGPTRRIGELRSRLQRFDDPELDLFCLEHYPQVYDKFSRGLRKDEKITMLLDHVRRRGDPADLLAAIQSWESAPAPAETSVRDVSLGTEEPPAPPVDVGPIRERWALLVGINRYEHAAVPTLKFCVNDVLALERTLKKLGYTVVTLHDEAADKRPTRNNIEAQLDLLCESVQPADLLWVHFACHGQLVDGQPVLVAHDTHVTTPATLRKQALSLADVEKRMRASGAHRLVLTLDACHVGVEMGRDLTDPAFIRNVHERAEGFALIAASTAQQKAQEWEEQEHGVFSYYLLEGLSGNADRNKQGFVTVNDLSEHVLNGLRRWNVKHGGLLQEPTARTEGIGDMILADYRKARKQERSW